MACLAFPSTPALAGPAPAGDPTTPPAVIDALERDLGLSEQQVVTRLANEQRAAAAEAVLNASLGGDSYAGAWLNADASKLMVATTDAAEAKAIEAKGAQPVVVSRTLGHLNAVKDQLDQAAAKAGTAASLWYVDVTTNSVVVLAATQEAGEALAAAVGDKDAVKVAVSTESPQPFIDIIGGSAYYIGSSRCSVGFSVTRGSTPGFVTAGHCGRAGARTTNPTGTFQGSSFPGNDYAWVAATGNNPTPYVRGSGGSLVTVRGSTQASVGASICRSGSTTGWRCGTIQQHNATVRYAQGTVYGLTRTSACAQPGDSGGSFISGSQAQGVTSGGSGNCSTGGTTYHQPVNEILSAYG
ncbi:S1 family peptidase, partial [Nonomuraea sp. MCN248]